MHAHLIYYPSSHTGTIYTLAVSQLNLTSNTKQEYINVGTPHNFCLDKLRSKMYFTLEIQLCQLSTKTSLFCHTLIYSK